MRMFNHEEMLKYRDKYFALVMKDVIDSQDREPWIAGMEDSAHKHGFLLSFLGWMNKSAICWPTCIYWRHDLSPSGDIQRRWVRHPKSQYTTSRDQVVPALIGLGAASRGLDLVMLWSYCKNTELFHDKYRGLHWLIRLLPHTDNGDVFQPHHVACYYRGLIDCSLGTKFTEKAMIWLGDFWFMLGAMISWTNATNTTAHIQGALMIEQAKQTYMTPFMRIASFFYNRFVDFDALIKEYFHRPDNPPMYELWREYQNSNQS